MISRGHFHSHTFFYSIITPQTAIEVTSPALQIHEVDDITGSSC